VLCQVCHRLGRRICQDCARELRPARDRLLPGGILLVGAFEHVGPAKSLIHALKYRGVRGYERLVAKVLAPRLPRLPLVPTPRAMSRRVTYGVDAARVIATAIADELDVPVVDLLRSPVHSRKRAGTDHRQPVARFASGSGPRGPVILVDDVVTTGATLLAGAASLGTVSMAVAANLVPEVSSLRDPQPRDPWPPY
jgi:predicted amidophosphoribosyltransferase